MKFWIQIKNGEMIKKNWNEIKLNAIFLLIDKNVFKSWRLKL